MSSRDVGSRRQRVERASAGLREGHHERSLLELRLDDPADVRLVVDDQHGRRQRAWRAPDSDERRDLRAMATQVEEQLREIRLAAHQHEQERLRRHRRHHGQPALVLEHREAEGAAAERRASSPAASTSGGTCAASPSASSPDSTAPSMSRPSRPSTTTASTPSRRRRELTRSRIVGMWSNSGSLGGEGLVSTGRTRRSPPPPVVSLAVVWAMRQDVHGRLARQGGVSVSYRVLHGHSARSGCTPLSHRPPFRERPWERPAPRPDARPAVRLSAGASAPCRTRPAGLPPRCHRMDGGLRG